MSVALILLVIAIILAVLGTIPIASPVNLHCASFLFYLLYVAVSGKLIG